MFDNGRKNVCVILCDVADHYQEQVCRTLTSYAQVRGFNLAYFSFFLCYGVNTKNGKGEANIINLVPYENFDGFIICHDTFQNQKAVEQMFKYIKERTSVPVVTLKRAWGDYPCVLAENTGAVKEIVQHFIDVHGYTRIAFMSGPEDHPDAQTRLADYRDGLKSRGLEYDEKLVFYGDFWRERSKEAARYYALELAERPQAVVCANDYMAISLCNAFIDMGLLVPDDIAVSGVDDIWEAATNMPPITTITMPVEKMSEQAFATLEKMMNGEQVPQVQKIAMTPVIRNSCGCDSMKLNTILKKRVRQNQEYEKMLDLVQNNTYMFVEMSDVDSAEEIVNYVRLLENEDNFVRHFFICLGEGKGNEYPKYRSVKPGYPKYMKAIGSVFERQIIETEVFPTEELLPKEVVEDEPMVYYFFPLHNLDQTFGYFAISYSGEHSCEKTFHSWIAILGNAMENLRLKRKTHTLLDELNNLYVHDALTGLFNRRGFENHSREYYKVTSVNRNTMVIFSIDMDNLKIVNDKFGHMQGDVALQTIANAIEHAAAPGDVCARVGGDEFSVVGIGYDEEKIKDFLDKFHSYLEAFNVDSGLPYLVSASCGYYLVPESHDTSLEAAIVESDNQLYATKKEKKAKKLDQVIRKEDM
ncbi:MAG: GGDEF domain-containing protein [Roseburia sp.]|nr:GGDEF domain-containing protein [Roseburia sp.]